MARATARHLVAGGETINRLVSRPKYRQTRGNIYANTCFNVQSGLSLIITKSFAMEIHRNGQGDLNKTNRVPSRLESGSPVKMSRQLV